MRTIVNHLYAGPIYRVNTRDTHLQLSGLGERLGAEPTEKFWPRLRFEPFTQTPLPLPTLKPNNDILNTDRFCQALHHRDTSNCKVHQKNSAFRVLLKITV